MGGGSRFNADSEKCLNSAQVAFPAHWPAPQLRSQDDLDPHNTRSLTHKRRSLADWSYRPSHGGDFIHPPLLQRYRLCSCDIANLTCTVIASSGLKPWFCSVGSSKYPAHRRKPAFTANAADRKHVALSQAAEAHRLLQEGRQTCVSPRRRATPMKLATRQIRASRPRTRRSSLTKRQMAP